MNRRVVLLLGSSIVVALAVLVPLYRQSPESAAVVRPSAEGAMEPRLAVVPPPAAPLPTEVKGVRKSSSPIGLREALFEPGYEYEARVGLLNRLTALGGNQAGELLLYLRDRENRAELRPGQRHALKNDAMNLLRMQEPPVEGLTQALIELWRDEDPVLQDYALQHLSQWIAAVNESERQAILSMFREAAARRDRSWSGTALLALHRENDGKTKDFAEAIVSDSGADVAARITALSVLGELSPTPAAKIALAEGMLRDGGPIGMRLAALNLTHQAVSADVELTERAHKMLEQTRLETNPLVLEAIRKIKLQLSL